MHRKYFLRKNYKAVCIDSDQLIMGHLAFKTKDSLWLGTSTPSLALISVQSAFHEGLEGRLKMEAFLSVIRSSVPGRVTALIADTAHLGARRLVEGDLAQDNCLKEGEDLVSRFQPLFAGYELIFWHDLKKKEEYSLLRCEILSHAQRDPLFQSLLESDAQKDLEQKRQNLYPDRQAFIKESIEDLIDECACLRLLARAGYGNLFYPGAPHQATAYLEAQMPFQIRWVDVFLTIERKSRLPTLGKY